MRTSDNMKGTLADIASLVKDEFKTISTSYAILLVLVGGIFLYGLLYNYMYAPDLVRNAPVVVVDDSKTDLSREYIRLLNATPQVSVIADGLDYAEAQEWMKEGDAVGILYLPSDFETRVARGNESLFIMYQTTSAFLYCYAGGFQRCHVGVERSVSSGDVGVLAPARRFQDRFGATHISGRDGVV